VPILTLKVGLKARKLVAMRLGWCIQANVITWNVYKSFSWS
jgi:hypothetical protein